MASASRGAQARGDHRATGYARAVHGDPTASPTRGATRGGPQSHGTIARPSRTGMPVVFILVSVLCSVFVSVLLKLAPRWRVDVGQAIAWNYALAGGATLLLLAPPLAPLTDASVPWWVLAALGLLLPTIFLAQAASVRTAGIARTDVAQRLSLVLPLVAAFVLFGERFNSAKLAGCVLGLAALAALVWRTRAQDAGHGGWRWPLLVFAGFGVIDVLFKRVAATGLPLGSALAVVFALALAVSFALLIARRARLEWRGLLGGIALGLANFGNIYFYLRAHRALPGEPSLVFASMNLGVVVLGSLTGLVLFRERLSRLNLAGLGLAVLAVLVLARA